MFMAGVELDLTMLVRSEAPTAIFTVLTFGVPMLLGFLVGRRSTTARRRRCCSVRSSRATP
jgi:Kef-type K+ transport system membrane component KefB